MQSRQTSILGLVTVLQNKDLNSEEDGEGSNICGYFSVLTTCLSLSELKLRSHLLSSPSPGGTIMSPLRL